MKLTVATTLVSAALFVSSGLTAKPMAGPSTADVPSGTYKVDPTHASVVWKVKHMGVAMYSARFTKFDAEIKYDAKAPTSSSMTATIDPKSIRTDYPYPEKENFDAKLSDDEKIFNSGKYPDIKFVSKKLVKTSATTGKLTGDLTLLGVTKPVTLNVTLSGTLKEHMYTKKPVLGFAATGTVKRSEFGMGFGIPMIGDDVQLDINGEFQKAD
jgi:polyisoprenoid-binding protein YceI